MYLGYQKNIDFYGCDFEKINSMEFIESTLIEAAKIMNLSIVNFTFHEFSPIGISGVVVIKESHIAIHSWPEHNYVAVDIFTCNQGYDLNSGIEFLMNKFESEKLKTQDIVRGNLSIVRKYEKE